MDRSRPNVLTSNGKKVTVTREVICGGQDVYAGSCSAFGTPGSIVFLFQLQSTATNVNVQIGKLPNVPSAVGVNACDDTLNTRELCTEDTNPPSLATLADSITAVSKNKTSVTFTIPSFPAFPAGVDSEEGQGLTIYVVVQQSAAVPLTYPNIGIF